MPQKRKYPFAEMGVGDAFFIPGYSVAKARKLRRHARDWSHNNTGGAWKFSVIKTKYGYTGVWLISKGKVRKPVSGRLSKAKYAVKKKKPVPSRE